ncbi:NACHT domain-containing protein [Pseudomonas neuropathica]|uniref:NACHT domain-containing protein n=1 Tax=Pseudomonas neuropathica TaxID=2730425 RepID=UPI003EBFCF25
MKVVGVVAKGGDMESKLSANHKFVLMVIVVGFFVVGIAYFASGLMAVFAAGFLCVLLYMLRVLVMPAGYGANKIRTLSLIGALGLAASWGAWSGALNSVIIAFSHDQGVLDNYPWLKYLKFDSQPSALVLFFVFSCIFVVNFFMRDRSIGSGHPVPLEKDFPGETFQGKLESFCSSLYQSLVVIDRVSNWSPEHYTELQAEVEVLPAHGMVPKRKIMNLQEAIRSDRTSQSFLILGVPGAGKSVALRKLARDMLREVGRTGRVPIYVNLREWVSELDVDAVRTRFDVKELEVFVTENIKKRGDVFVEEFVDEHFRDLWRHGRLFFIFDSFDEIPELLDANEDSEIINSLSDVISRFISSHKNSRGVLASRIFRKPTQAFLAQKTLEIRPLSESSILEALNRYPEFSSDLKASLFRDRLDLIPLARNPFLMTLLGSWVSLQHDLPQNQAQIYESYIRSRLGQCASKMTQYDLTIDEVLAITTDIAWFVFNSPSFGLEAPVVVINDHVLSRKVQAVIYILNFARIARVTEGDDKSFAFVHRRFLEYFVTVKLLENPLEAPIDHIPTDSRGRDALVLYAQLCELDEARRLADICWKEIQDTFEDDTQRLRAIHCLRFLIDAYCSRRSAIDGFEEQLSAFIMSHVSGGDSIILAKICLEGTGLLSEIESAPVLSVAISGTDTWLQETAFRACRHLPRMEKKLEEGISRYVSEIPIVHFWKNRTSINLSLSLSEALKGVYRTSRVREANLKMSVSAALASMVAVPYIWIFGMFYVVLTMLAFFGVAAHLNSTKQKATVATLKNGGRSGSGSINDFVRKMLRGSTTLNFFITTTRIFLGILLLVVGALYLSVPDGLGGFGGLYGSEFEESYSVPKYFLSLGLIVCGGLMLDWLLTLRAARAFYKNISNLKALFLVAAMLVVTVSIVCFMEYILGYLANHKVTSYILGGLLGVVVIVVFFVILWSMARSCFMVVRDVVLLNGIRINSRMAREDISRALLLLSTEHGKTLLVNKLDRNRVVAIGVWPDSFKLAVGSGSSISALARLEERWLKLDR